MTFSAIVDADTLTDALDPVTALVNECKIRTNDNGLSITAVDPANVGMVDMSLDAGACASYSPRDRDTPLGVNLKRLTDVIGMADSGDMVALELDDETRKLHIEIDGLEYTLALIDPESIRQEPDLPDLDLAATYVFEGRRLDRAVTAAEMVSNHIAIEAVGEDELVFSADGDTDDVTETLTGDQLLSGRHEGDGAAESLFSLDYLADIASVIGSDDELSLRIGDEFPLKLHYTREDGGISVTNMLAPRIQSE